MKLSRIGNIKYIDARRFLNDLTDALGFSLKDKGMRVFTGLSANRMTGCLLTESTMIKARHLWPFSTGIARFSINGSEYQHYDVGIQCLRGRFYEILLKNSRRLLMDQEYVFDAAFLYEWLEPGGMIRLKGKSSAYLGELNSAY